MYEDLANLDALAAGTQGILHGLSTADDAHAAQLLGKVDTHILRASGCDDCVLSKGQMTKACLNHLLHQYMFCVIAEQFGAQDHGKMCGDFLLQSPHFILLAVTSRYEDTVYKDNLDVRILTAMSLLSSDIFLFLY